MARIMIVEDNDDLRGLLQVRLEMEGFEVVTAPDGARALALMAGQPADLVLTDIFMPDKDGLETIVELRGRHPGAKIVAMSGWQSPQAVDYLNVAREIGAVHAVKKPFDIEALVSVVQRLISADRTAGASRSTPPE